MGSGGAVGAWATPFSRLREASVPKRTEEKRSRRCYPTLLPKSRPRVRRGGVSWRTSSAGKRAIASRAGSVPEFSS
eukprot:713040-Lingulodinium_polyedra.AAC.1